MYGNLSVNALHPCAKLGNPVPVTPALGSKDRQILEAHWLASQVKTVNSGSVKGLVSRQRSKES